MTAMKPYDPRKTKRVGRPPASETADRRKDLLVSATRLFTQKGFAKVELREIAENANVTVGLIRHYFGSKDALIDEVTEQVIEKLSAVYEKIISGIDARSGEEFIDVLYERTYETLMPEVDLLFFLKHMAIELPEKSFPVFQKYFDLIQSALNGLEAIGEIDPQVNKVWLNFMLMFVQLGPVFLSRQVEDILGFPARDPEATRLRNANNARVLKYGIIPRSQARRDA